jgi:hypothetical protein
VALAVLAVAALIRVTMHAIREDESIAAYAARQLRLALR